jgi:hypothetical protein
MPRPAFTDSPEGALAALSVMCDEEIVAKLVKGIAAGELEFVADPEHRQVWGVREVGEQDPRKVRLVVYTDAGDFELDEEWWLS